MLQKQNSRTTQKRFPEIHTIQNIADLALGLNNIYKWNWWEMADLIYKIYDPPPTDILDEGLIPTQETQTLQIGQ